MTVSILSLAAKGENEAIAVFEISDGDNRQRESFVLGISRVVELGLRAGECTRELYDAVSLASEEHLATQKGLVILGNGPCSPKMLIRKLRMKGFSEEASVSALRELKKMGYLDSERDATVEAERGVGKLWGRRRIVAELYNKGYSDGDVKSAILALEDSEVDFLELCAERIRKDVRRSPEDPMERRKIIASLERYGFTFSEIKEALNIVYNKKSL